MRKARNGILVEYGDAQGAKTIEFVRAIEKAHGIIDTDNGGKEE